MHLDALLLPRPSARSFFCGCSLLERPGAQLAFSSQNDSHPVPGLYPVIQSAPLFYSNTLVANSIRKRAPLSAPPPTLWRRIVLSEQDEPPRLPKGFEPEAE